MMPVRCYPSQQSWAESLTQHRVHPPYSPVLYGPSSYLESGLRVVPVGPQDIGLLRWQRGDVDGVLLRTLVLVVVGDASREEDLRVVVDVAPHVERALLKKETLSKTAVLSYVDCVIPRRPGSL